MAIIFILSFLLFFTVVRLVSRHGVKKAQRRMERQHRAWIREEVKRETSKNSRYSNIFAETADETPQTRFTDDYVTETDEVHAAATVDYTGGDEYAYEFDRGFLEHLGIAPESLYPGTGSPRA